MYERLKVLVVKLYLIAIVMMGFLLNKLKMLVYATTTESELDAIPL